MKSSFEEVFKYQTDIRDREKEEEKKEFDKFVLGLCERRRIKFEAFPKEEYEKLWGLSQKAEEAIDEIIYEDDAPVLRLAQAVKQYDDSEIEKIRNSRYEINHTKITNCVFEHLRNYQSFPMVAVIVEVTGLSRQTIHKHLKSISKESYSKRYRQTIDLTRQMILEKLAGKYLGEDDLKSAALYLRFTEEKQVGVQLNNITLNKQVVNNLTTGQMEAIETIIIGEEEEENVNFC